MEKNFVPDKKLKRKLVKRWLPTQRGYKVRATIGWILAAIAAVIFIGVTLMPLFFDDRLVTILLFAAAGLGIALIPGIIAHSLFYNAVRKGGEPYGIMRSEFLYVNKTGIQFGYHDVRDTDNPASVRVYQIGFGVIQSVNYDERGGMVTVTGEYEQLSYRDMSLDQLIYRYQAGPFINNTFSFLLYFKDKEVFLDLLRDKELLTVSRV